MQYGAELFPYQRVHKVKKELKTGKEVHAFIVLAWIAYFFAGLLISRVLLINSTAPFGLAFFLAVVIERDEKIPLVIGSGALFGYISLYGNLNGIPLYILSLGTIAGVGYAMQQLGEKKQIAVILTSILLEFGCYKYFVGHLTLGVAFFTALLETICIYPIYFILHYAIICYKDIKTKHLYMNEEIISMTIMASLIVAGTWGVSLFGVSLRNILALTIVVTIAYVKGSAVGAAGGVAVGIIVGMSSADLSNFISIYGLSGLIAGVFKETGKWLSGISYLIAFLIVKVYSNIMGDFKVIEAVISCGVLYAVPNTFYQKMRLEFDWETKQQYISEQYVNKIKGILVGRLDNFSDVLYNMSEILSNLVDNEKLEMKGKSSALIENLADRVCSNCNMNSMCWKREIYYTYESFSELIQNIEENKGKVPKEIDRKCIKRTALMKNAEEIVNGYVISEMWRRRLREGRELLATQINSMADSVGEIVEEFSSDIKIRSEEEKLVRRILDKHFVKYDDVLCLVDKKGRLSVRMTMDACGGRQLCVKDVLPFINEALNKCMCVSDEGCQIQHENNKCNVIFEETPKFHVASYVGRQSKEGEKYNGDSYSFEKLSDGTYLTMISDGMGSGPQAGKESQAAIDLIERFTSAGFSKATAINAVNSVMTLKFSTDEKFSTVDLSSIDLYNGEIEFMKVGAVASFIKSGSKVQIVKSKTLPIGVLDKVDIEVTKKTVKNGDVVVMVSDGILDYNDEQMGREDWVAEYLAKFDSQNPKDIAEGLISRARELSGGRTKDDMTVIVSKVYNLY